MAEIAALASRFNEAYQKGKYTEAAELCTVLVKEYEASGEVLSAAEMKNNLSVVLLKDGKAAQALAAAEGTQRVFEEAGDSRRQAMALGNQAAALEALGKLDQAADLYLQSAELLKKIDDKELYSLVMKSLTAIYLKQGKQMDTVIALQASLEDDKRLSPRDKFLKRILKRVLSFLP